jgi:hypothetical protein
LVYYIATMLRRTRSLLLLLPVLLPLFVSPPALAAAKDKGKDKAGGADKPEAAEPDDVTAVKDKLKLLSDGKKHYLALVPFDEAHVYYGDGKTFHLQRIYATLAETGKSFSFTFWDPRVKHGYQADISLKDGKFTVQCDERKTELVPVAADESSKLLGAAQFTKALWQYRAYALARDERGTYYYVDRRREPPGSLDFRLFVGPRGQMKRLQMTNVVSDSGGDIFSTKAGELRLILDRHESLWMKGGQRTKLTSVPVEDNAVLIYTDLGAYMGQRLGTPCDDL